jgi:hypothetical protein
MIWFDLLSSNSQEMYIMQWSAPISVLLLVTFTSQSVGQQNFAQATNAMEKIIFNQPKVQAADVATMDAVLKFVSANLPSSAFGLPRSTGSASSCSYRNEWRRYYFRDCCGRLCYRWVCVRVRTEPKRYGAMTTLARKVEELQDAIAEFPNDPAINLRDLALQVYGVTLSADTDSQAGRINR